MGLRPLEKENQMPGIRRLNHAVLFVSDLQRAVDFYTGVLGFEVMSREPRMNAAFFRVPNSANHHDLGLFGIGAGAAPHQRGQTGLYHLAWQVDTLDDLVELRGALIESGNITGESSHGATLSVYGADPDGNEFELMWMLPREAWGEYETEAVVERLDLEAELARWSGVGTADELGSPQVG
jgi:catechol-2,3-dioxygenase